MKEINELLLGIVEILQVEELEERLTSGKQLIIKAGFDPTAPDLHLGHIVILNKLRMFQDMGHTVKLVVGDFTGMIGDPSGRDVTRPPMSKEAIKENAVSYVEQAFKVLDRDATEVHFNSSWFKDFSFADVLHLCAQYTVSRMLERDDFGKRHRAGHGIGIHEFLYPLMQGYDSVVLSADIEIGGTDQKFNLLVGRHLQKAWKQEPQVVMMLPILVGLDGYRKMSKSFDNYIGITEDAQAMFGKIMSLSDKLMWNYFALVSSLSSNEVDALKCEAEQGKNPRDIKMSLAYDVVSRFHNKALAEKAQADFVQRFRYGMVPDEIETCHLKVEGDGLPLFKVLQMSSLTDSSSEAQRMIEQGAVKIDGVKIEDANAHIEVCTEAIYQVGKRRFKRILLIPKKLT